MGKEKTAAIFADELRLPFYADGTEAILGWGDARLVNVAVIQEAMDEAYARGQREALKMVDDLMDKEIGEHHPGGPPYMLLFSIWSAIRALPIKEREGV